MATAAVMAYSAYSSKRAGDKQAKAGRKSGAIQERKWEYGKGAVEDFQEKLTPYEEAGGESLQAYRDLLEDPSSVKDTPGYEFGLSEGRRAIEQGASARGTLFSGQTMKRLMEYGSDYFSQQYDKALNRRKQMIDVGQSALGMRGQSSVALMGGATQVGARIGNALQTGVAGQAKSMAQGAGTAESAGEMYMDYRAGKKSGIY